MVLSLYLLTTIINSFFLSKKGGERNVITFWWVLPKAPKSMNFSPQIRLKKHWIWTICTRSANQKRGKQARELTKDSTLYFIQKRKENDMYLFFISYIYPKPLFICLYKINTDKIYLNIINNLDVINFVKFNIE